MKEFKKISFRLLPDEDGDSATFLSFFLPKEEKARQTSAMLGKAGVDGCFYWYANKWHYYRQWEHLKSLSSSAKLPLTLLKNIPDYKNMALEQSDRIMSKMISMQIKLSWKDNEIAQRIEKISDVLKQI